MLGILGAIVKFPLKHMFVTTAAAGAAWWNRDALAEKKDQLVEQYNEQGLEKTAASVGNDIVESTTNVVVSAGEKLDITKEIVDDPTGFADRKMNEAFDRVMNPDGDGDLDNPANNNDSGSIFSAIGKLSNGDFSGAASALTGDDGFDLGDGAKLGGIATLLYGLFKFFSSDKGEDNDGGGLINSTTLTIGLAALAFFNRDMIMDKVNDFTSNKPSDVFNAPELDMG